MKKIKLPLIILIAFGVQFFAGCSEYSVSMEKKQSSYNPFVYEHILNLTFPHAAEKNQTLCIEEEFDLAEGEITDFKIIKRPGGISLILNTSKERYYILNFNPDGKFVLHRID